MYEVIATNQFKKYYKQCIKRKYDIESLFQENKADAGNVT